MNPILELEQKVSDFFGSPYAVAVDCCTHGMDILVSAYDI
jgi:dTDP-4-amino-4,6-dideoxygalactose transaminase